MSSSALTVVTAVKLSEYLTAPLTSELTNEAKEWLPSMFDGGIFKILAALNASHSSSLSPSSIKDALLSLLPEDSDIGLKSLSNAESITEKYRSMGKEESNFPEIGIKLDKASLRAVVLESSVFQADQASELSLEVSLVFLAGLMEGIYAAFMHTVEELTPANPETSVKVIGEEQIAAAWAARLSDWSALFVVRGTQEEEEEEVLAVEAIIKEEAQFLLKIIMVQEQGTVTKLLKVESSIVVRELAQKIKKKMLTPTQVAENKRYYLFWHDEESDDTEGLFLEDDKILSDYPSVRTESTIELVLAERNLQVYVSEISLKSCYIDERFPLEKIIKTIVTDLGYREASRFGLILLAEETEGFETPAQAKLKSSKSFDVVQIKKDHTGGSSDSLKVGRSGSVKKNTKRPVSNVFVKGESGSVKNKVADKRGVNLLATIPPAGSSPYQSPAAPISALTASLNSLPGSSSYSSSPASSSPLSGSPPTSGILSRTPPQNASPLSGDVAPLREPSLRPHAPLSNRLSLIETHVIVQTKDRSEWLNRDLTLKELGIEIFDSMLLVRQEKILSFYDRLDEDPIGLYSRLTEQADNILKQIESMSGEIDAMKAGVVMLTSKKELMKVLTEHRGDDEFYVRVGDEIEVIKRDGERWFGRVASSGIEGFFPSSIVQDPNRKGSQEPAKLKARPTMSADGEQPVKMEGYLLKKGRNFDHWKKKYYRLRNRCMWYYKSEKDEKPVGHFSILGAKIIAEPSHKKKANTFVIVADGVERYLSAPSDEQMAHWVAILNDEKGT